MVRLVVRLRTSKAVRLGLNIDNFYRIQFYFFSLFVIKKQTRIFQAITIRAVALERLPEPKSGLMKELII